MKHSKQEKLPCVKGKKKTGPKKTKVEEFNSAKKSDLAASNKIIVLGSASLLQMPCRNQSRNQIN